MALFLAGQRVTAQDLDDALPIQVGVTTTSFSLTSNVSTYYPVSFTAQSSSNTTGMWSVSDPTKLYLPTDGTYTVQGYTNWPATLGSNDGRGQFLLNGTGSPIVTAKCDTVAGSTGNITGAITGWVVGHAGDYIQLVMNQNSGSACTLTVALVMTRVSTATA